MPEKGYTTIPIRIEEKKELDRRKSKCKWKTNRPKLSWGKFLLEGTEKWGEKNEH